jgi:hypothetical protein
MYHVAASLCVIVLSTQGHAYDNTRQTHSLDIISESSASIEIALRFDDITIDSIVINNKYMHIISSSGMLSPSLQEGAPSLPSIGRYIALPQDASARVFILAQHTKTYHNVDVAPVPDIPLETDLSPVCYEKDKAIYDRNAYYPDQPVTLSDPMKLRGVDVVILGITPFQYNPTTRELIVYTDIRICVDFIGGTGHFGEDRLRSLYWEPILCGHILNYRTLPHIDLLNRPPRDGCEYIIIVPDDSVFEAWADTIRNWRQLQGIYTEVFTLTEIGGSSATAIEAFIDSAYNNWSMPPVAVLLLSDYPTSGDAYGITSPVWNGYCTSDNIYADVDGDNLPDIDVARISAQTESHLSIMINRILTYERSPYTDPGFYDHPLLCCALDSTNWFLLTTEIQNGFYRNVFNKNPARQYGGTPPPSGSSWSSAPNTDLLIARFGLAGLAYITDTVPHGIPGGGNAGGINTAINAGAFLVNYRGPGAEGQWGNPLYHLSDLAGLTNNMYPFVFSVACLTGRYSSSTVCLAEAFHRQYNGCLGIIAATQLSYSFVNDIYNLGLYDCLWPTFDPYYPVPRMPGHTDLRPGFANVYAKYYLHAWDISPYNQHKVHTYHLFHMFGDAFTTLYSDMPQTLTVTHPPYMPPGVTYFPVQANDSSIIALTVNNEIIGVAEGTDAPVNVTIPPQTPGSVVKITATKANFYRYEADVPVVATYNGLIMLGHVVDDSSGGNNDGQVNPGEIIDYGVWLGNVWPPDTVYSVYALLSISGPYITPMIDSSWFGDVPAEDSMLSDPFYRFSVDESCPIGHTIQLMLESHDINDSIRHFYPSLTVYDPAGVDEEPLSTTTPVQTQLNRLYPNPCSKAVDIAYQLALRENVRLQVFDAAGCRVRSLLNHTQNPGNYTITWDGLDDKGHLVSAGIYFFALSCGECVYMKKIVLLR